ncbi:universal stress protein [Streptomyces sp. ISL-98]|uniref:universal stress protein n=1 Tax=Streptomyces sp. ISL-98 TaxID=2819192 RepID=UPI001BE74D87|nr:universal stress protein [Streptomyces sp. ISL-98]MBT2507429.1 universal stress protein [Streptomyces sp. ISL-98]
MTRPLIAGLDGSAESLAAARWAAREALLRGSRLDLVHAEEYPTTATVPMAGPDVQRRWADTLLHETADDLRNRHPELEITTRRVEGRPFEVLSAEAAAAEMLVLGSRGLGSIVGFLVGSVGMATISATEQPVVLVRAPSLPDEETPAGLPHGDVVVGVDIHQSCDKLLGFAFDEASRRGATLRVVHAWSLPPTYSYASALEPDIQLDVGQRVTQALSNLLLPWRGRYPSVTVDEKSVAGPAAQQVLYAGDGAGLVVVGRRIRRSPLGGHIGHITHAVIHHAASPVAVVAHD